MTQRWTSRSEAARGPSESREPAPGPAKAAERSLRWQLGRGYMRVTLVAVLVLEALVLLIGAQSVLIAGSRTHRAAAEAVGPILTELLVDGAPPGSLDVVLDRPLASADDRSVRVTLAHPPQGWTFVADARGTAWFDNRVGTSRGLDRHASRLVEGVLADGTPRTGREPLRILRAVPLTGSDGARVGVLLQATTLPQATPGLLAVVLAGVLLATLAVVLFGTWFGLIASKPLTRRIGRLADAADAWSRGDLTRTVGDDVGDELGRLSRRLDLMAKEFDELLRARQMFATTEERTRIARELHDSVKQQLFAASMRLGAARIVPPQEVEGHLDAVARLIDEAKSELSHLIHELRPAAIEGREIEDALRSLVTRYSDDDGPVVDLQVDPHLAVTSDVSATLYRIVQEAVSNALRHSGAARVSVCLRSVDHTVELTVEDDGRGFDPATARQGFGLASMRERASRLGGELEVRPRDEGGARVQARLPLRRDRPPTYGASGRRRRWSDRPNAQDGASGGTSPSGAEDAT